MRGLADVNILLVEDDRDTREMYAAYFSHLGMHVDTAADGREALARVAAAPPEVIVMDVGMPHMPGDEAAHRLKSDAATRHIPIIALSGFGLVSKPDMDRAQFDVFCKKPCLPVDLAAIIRSTLAER
jgi:two-component system, cell cycle response regulator DivK